MEQVLEGQSDKSRSMSDSGGLIDLSAVDSDRKEGESSLGRRPGTETHERMPPTNRRDCAFSFTADKSSSSGGGKEEGEETQSKLPGAEAWLTDKLKGIVHSHEPAVRTASLAPHVQT